jgi:hypothetical protein
MKLFLVKVQVTERRYMREESPETCEKLHIVRADDEYQAASKVNKHYESKTESYCVYYDSVVLDVTEEIN